MKLLILTIIIFSNFCLTAQCRKTNHSYHKVDYYSPIFGYVEGGKKSEVYRFYGISALQILSGSLRCSKEINDHNNDYFIARFPNANKRFWGEDSWKNKYKNGDKNQGERFKGSTTIFVPFTDGWHLLGMAERVTFSYSFYLGIKSQNDKYVKWYHYIARFAWFTASNYIGYNLTDRYIYNHK